MQSSPFFHVCQEIVESMGGNKRTIGTLDPVDGDLADLHRMVLQHAQITETLMNAVIMDAVRIDIDESATIPDLAGATSNASLVTGLLDRRLNTSSNPEPRMTDTATSSSHEHGPVDRSAYDVTDEASRLPEDLDSLFGGRSNIRCVQFHP